MPRRTPALALITFLLAACGGGDDGAGPGANQPPFFLDAPAALAPAGLLLNVVEGDQILFSARGRDPDVEDVYYQWEIGRDTGGGFVPVIDAGSFTGAQTATPMWTVGVLTAPVRVRCTLTDGKDSVSASVGREFAPGTPVVAASIDVDTKFDTVSMPYVVKGHLTVLEGAELELGPGVELQFRPDRLSGVSWDKRALQVSGSLVASGELQAPVILRGGYSSSPTGVGPQQFRGIEVNDPGRADLTYLRVVGAETGIRIVSPTTSIVAFSNFERCITGVRVERGVSTVLQTCVLEDNSVGLQLNNSGVALQGCAMRDNSLYGIDVDASSAPVDLLVEGSGFASNLQGHLRMGGNFTIVATVRGSNFLPQAEAAVNLMSACGIYQLELRGNYWGPASAPSTILNAFENKKDCGVGVLGWTDSDCGGDPFACDWSGQPW